MAQLYTKIKLYLDANSKSWNDDNIILQDDGDGPYIKDWSIDGLAKPSDTQLNSYESAGNIVDANNLVRKTRKKAYGDIGEQLDEIYKDIDAWKARIKSIKDANPKS
tara:strand:+ start:473 stop:793 length:321 start_codon:yes stop_codon:yes gene_type:complete